jgi:hypothetical protein
MMVLTARNGPTRRRDHFRTIGVNTWTRGISTLPWPGFPLESEIRPRRGSGVYRVRKGEEEERPLPE